MSQALSKPTIVRSMSGIRAVVFSIVILKNGVKTTLGLDTNAETNSYSTFIGGGKMTKVWESKERFLPIEFCPLKQDKYLMKLYKTVSNDIETDLIEAGYYEKEEI